VTLLTLILFFSSIPGLTGETASTSLDTREVIAQMAAQEVESRFDQELYRFEMEPRWIPASLLKVTASQIRSVELTGNIETYTNFEVVYVSAHRTRKTQIQMKIEAEQQLPVPVMRMVSGSRIDKDDVEMRWIPIQLGRDKWVQTPELLIGKVLRRTKNAGDPIAEDDISETLLVEAGDEVQIVFTEYGIEISVTCEARQDASAHEQVVVYCKETRKKYLGEVTNPGVIQWIKTL
tara:strand:+ start:223962 stop:224666 length:705 start_codon:yes stop_codon:yes gene_type:complete